MRTKTVNRQLVGKKDIAKALGVSVRTIEEYMRKRIIPFFRIGNATVRFDPEIVFQHLSQHNEVA